MSSHPAQPARRPAGAPRSPRRTRCGSPPSRSATTTRRPTPTTVSYGPPVPAVTVHDPERGRAGAGRPRTQQVVGFSIPDFNAWHAGHAEPDGGFEIDLPPTWPLGAGERAGDADDEG